MTAYTDNFRAHETLEEHNVFSHEYIVHGDDEYMMKVIHTCIPTRATDYLYGHGSRPIELL